MVLLKINIGRKVNSWPINFMKDYYIEMTMTTGSKAWDFMISGPFGMLAYWANMYPAKLGHFYNTKKVLLRPK